MWLVILAVVVVVLLVVWFAMPSMVSVPLSEPVPTYAYQYYPNHDMRSDVLSKAYEDANDIPALKAKCNLNPNCAGFSSYGLLRRDWLPHRLVDMTSDKYAGHYDAQSMIPGVTGAYKRL